MPLTSLMPCYEVRGLGFRVLGFGLGVLGFWGCFWYLPKAHTHLSFEREASSTRRNCIKRDDFYVFAVSPSLQALVT